MVFYPINNAPTILGMIMIGFFILHILSVKGKTSYQLDKPILWWLAFSAYILFVGYYVAPDKLLLLASVKTYFFTLVAMVFIIGVSKSEKNSNFFINNYAILAVVYALTLIFWGYYNGSVVSISKTSNTNGDGITMMFGIFCLSLNLDIKKSVRFLLSYVSIGLLLYAIVLTGSRKSLLCAMLLIVLCGVIFFRNSWKIASSKQKRFLFILFWFTIIFAVIAIFIPFFVSSRTYVRLMGSFTNQSDQTRINMYMKAIEYLKTNVLFGIGFDQFRVVSDWLTYSHSTYAEILACTGIIGTTLYFVPYLIIINNLIKVSRKQKQKLMRDQSKLYLALMFVMIFLAAGAILFYDLVSNIMFALMISLYSIHNNASKVEVNADINRRLN